jgi:hypothetical protein
MKMKRLLSLAPVALAALAASTMGAISVAAAPVSVRPTPGQVVAVSGTPNLWIADSQGVLHFASDPVALAGQSVDWQSRVDLTADELETLSVGAPWLSMALVRIGDQIYVPQWDPRTNASAPTLRHIQTTDDLTMLGVGAGNYQEIVLDEATWEQRYGLSIDEVAFGGDLVLTLPPAAIAPEPEASTESAADSGVAAAEVTSEPMTITVEGGQEEPIPIPPEEGGYH